ncbi:hypothetical protein SAMN04488132_104115 [Sediminibacterium ginsengisoli]|uniref:Uncharacterized protein n=2 Tax=Sediminibacterium ginsengisoli TaxID=413434 RepID=A0A1T4N6R5_9BACT|nr:hypothetical protein SAMN04488132_104115 [Sediminibacterium ginsengisoli]
MISFIYDGERMEGRVRTDHADKYKLPVSYSVTLNGVFFDYLTRNNGAWQSAEEHPQDLVDAIGNCIDQTE